jgi:hypothetical protein
VSIPFLYFSAEFTSVCCTIVGTCKLNSALLYIKSDELIFSNSYHLLYAGTFLSSFSLFMLSLIKPDHFYQVCWNHSLTARLLGTYFSLDPILDLPFAGDWLWARVRPDARSKHCGSFTLFQKKTDLGYGACRSWLFTGFHDPSHPAKQPIFSDWVP